MGARVEDPRNHCARHTENEVPSWGAGGLERYTDAIRNMHAQKLKCRHRETASVRCTHSYSLGAGVEDPKKLYEALRNRDAVVGESGGRLLVHIALTAVLRC